MAETWQQMKPRVIASYKRRRSELVERMGSKCEWCGEADQTKLELHHTKPREWVASKLSRWQRIKRCEEEFEQGVLMLLCKRCNLQAGQPDDVPF